MIKITLQNKGKNEQGGFIALTATLVLTIVLMMLIFANNTSSYFARFDALGSENKRISAGLSEACTNAALLKLGQNYDYDPSNDEVSLDSGVPDYKCSIDSIETLSTDHNSKTVKINTSAEYPSVNGSWSTNSIQAVIQNPSVSTSDPICSLSATPGSITAGLPITVQWLASANATSFSLTPTPSPAITGSEAESGTRTFTIASPGSVTFTGIATSAAGASSSPCTATVTVTSPPPSPSCADTVMIFDRTGSLSTTDRSNEKSAGNALIDLYSGVNSLPKVSVGSFGGYPSGAASVPSSPNGQLQTTYSALKSALSTILGSSSSVGSDLSAAINAGYGELNSSRHSAGLKKVMLLVSDGVPSKPSGNLSNDQETALNSADTAKRNGVTIFTIHYGDSSGQNFLASLASGDVPYPSGDTGLLTPSSNQTVVAGWNNPGNANGAADGNAATAVNHTNATQRYSFNTIPAIPAGSTVNSLAVSATLGSPSSAILPVIALGTDTWSGSPTNTAAGRLNAVKTNDGSTSYITTTGNGKAETFAFSSAGVPAGASISSVQFHLLAKGSGTTISLTFQTAGKPLFTDTARALNNSFNSVYDDSTFAVNPSTGAAWTLADINNTSFGVKKVSGSGSSQVTYAYLEVDYSLPSSGCQFGVKTSWDGGTNWTTEQTLGVPASATLETWSSWSHAFTAAEVTNAKFKIQVRAIDPGAACSDTFVTNLDTLQLEVKYGSSHEDGSDNQYGGNATQENKDDDDFFIAPSSSDISTIFQTIGKKVCPALAPACSNTVDDDGDGLIDRDDPSCHTDGNASNSASYDPDDNDEWTAPTIAPLTLPPLAPISINSWYELPH